MSSTSNAEVVGPITIMENGVAVTRYALSTYAATISTDGSSLTMEHNSGIQIASQAEENYTNPYAYVGYNLNGATVSFTADYSGVSCSCNGALYFVTMPALDSNSNPTAGDWGIYYCDANDVNGEWCWEMDIIEANMYASQTTPHTCDEAPGTPTTSCDGAGCGTNTYYENNSGLCPSSSCTINTKYPFDFSITMNSDSYHVKIQQNGQTFGFHVCGDDSYLNNMVQALDFGMVLVISYWGSDYSIMSWLDGATGCTGDCVNPGNITFSDISISKENGESVTVDTSKWTQVPVNDDDEFELKENSNVNSIKGHKFKTVEGKYGSKGRLSVPQ